MDCGEVDVGAGVVAQEVAAILHCVVGVVIEQICRTMQCMPQHQLRQLAFMP